VHNLFSPLALNAVGYLVLLPIGHAHELHPLLYSNSIKYVLLLDNHVLLVIILRLFLVILARHCISVVLGGLVGVIES
jgi:hypothetical protein